MGISSQPQQHDEAVDWAQRWSQTWFLDDSGADRFQFDGISGGWATHVEAFLILLDLARRTVTRRPSGISPFGSLKRGGYDRLARAYGLRLMRAPEIGRNAIAAIIEVPTPSMAEPLGLVAGAGGPGCVIGVADPRAAGILSRQGLQAYPLSVRWSDERRLLKAAESKLRSAWASFETVHQAMALDSEDLTRAAVRRLRPLVLRSMPWLAVERAAIRVYLEQVNPLAVAIASDQHRIGRLAVGTAREMGIRSVVVQHGMPQTRIGYLPVVADRVAAWSDTSRDWFMRGGARPGTVVVTGNPRADTLRDLAGTPPSDFSVLVALSGAAPGINETLIQCVAEAVTSLGGVRMTVKLHPGHREWAGVRRVIRHLATDVEILWRTPLPDVLREAAVVVVNRSSVVLEALIAGRPVVAYRTGSELTSAELDVPELRLPTAERVQQLTQLLEALRTPRAREAFVSEREAALMSTAGPTDGKSVQRILTLMSDASLRSSRADDDLESCVDEHSRR